MKNQTQHQVPYAIEKITSVRSDLLAPIDYDYAGRRDIVITIEQPEFTSVCPMTGLPDFGTVTIKYQPDQKIIELKSLKFYLLQYRNVGIFYEHVVNHILDNLVAALAPKWMEVKGAFSARGGIVTDVVASYTADAE